MATKDSKKTHRKSSNNPLPASESRTPGAPANGLTSTASSHDVLRALYSALLHCLITQDHLRQQAKAAGEANGQPLGIDRAAIAVGTVANLAQGDTLAASRTDLAAMIAKGMPLGRLLTGIAEEGNATPTLPDDPFNAGTGIALAHKLEQRGRVVIALCPQANPSLEVWHEALKFAASHKLPILFVIQNGVATQSPENGDPPYLEAFSFMARDHGFPGIIVDGNDVVAVWRVTQEAIHRARNGSGPTLIDCTNDGQQDALAHMERYLRKRNAWDNTWKQQIESKIRAGLAVGR